MKKVRPRNWPYAAHASFSRLKSNQETTIRVLAVWKILLSRSALRKRDQVSANSLILGDDFD
jgi:hypothetical protein